MQAGWVLHVEYENRFDSCANRKCLIDTRVAAKSKYLIHIVNVLKLKQRKSCSSAKRRLLFVFDE